MTNHRAPPPPWPRTCGRGPASLLPSNRAAGAANHRPAGCYRARRCRGSRGGERAFTFTCPSRERRRSAATPTNINSQHPSLPSVAKNASGPGSDRGSDGSGSALSRNTCVRRDQRPVGGAPPAGGGANRDTCGHT